MQTNTVNTIEFKIRMINVRLLSLVLLLTVMSVQANDVFKIAANNHYVSGYWEEMLTTGLELTKEEFGPYEIVIHKHALGNDKHMQEMIKGELINARVGVTTLERESAYITIKIPLRKGLLNYRVLVVNRSELEKFKGIENLEQLKKLKAGLVDRWIISDLFQQQDFSLMRIVDYNSLFRMLMAKRYDYTTRGVNEVYTELEFNQPEGADLAIVPNIGLYINTPSYLFISKQHPRLAKRIETGFELMLESGQFDEIFYKWHQSSIDRAGIKHRKFFKIENPFMSLISLPTRPELWFQNPPN